MATLPTGNAEHAEHAEYAENVFVLILETHQSYLTFRLLETGDELRPVTRVNLSTDFTSTTRSARPASRSGNRNRNEARSTRAASAFRAQPQTRDRASQSRHMLR